MVGGQTYGIEAMQDVAELMHGIREACIAQRIPVDTLITENAPSQYEINLYHQPDAVLACDQALMLKRAIKGVSRKHGKHATFMAKPFGDEGGSGFHLHLSVTDVDGSHMMDDESGELSTVCRRMIAGILEHAPALVAFCNPTVNAYKRLGPDTMAPYRSNWGYDNRSTMLRIPPERGQGTRAELRIGLCGDWLNGGDVQGAWLSGRALAAQILQSTQIQSSGAVHA